MKVLFVKHRKHFSFWSKFLLTGAVIVGSIFLAHTRFLKVHIAHAAGGPCPTSAIYGANGNQTLASLGVTSCFYASASGSDSNSGTSESSPWLHAPGMATCSGNCAAVTPSGGTGFIFRGGDTWHFGNSGAAPYAGVKSNCANNGQTSGGLCLDNFQAASGSPIYYGVDKSWYSGGSWSRPILTSDNSPCNAGTIGTMPDGANCSNGTDPTGNGQPTYVVSACSYQVGANNSLVDIGFSKYVYFDNFELTGLCMKDVGQWDGNDTYIVYGGDQGPTYILNNYIHGDSHVPFAGANSSAACTSSSVCMNLYAFNGKVIVGTVGETVAGNVVDFSDSDPAGTGICYPGTGFYNVAYNVFRYTSQCIPVNLHVFHDNLYEYYYENGHSNLIEDAETSPIGTMYNNVFRHLYGKLVFWPGPVGSSDASYFFNNVVYDVSTAQYFDYGGLGVTNDSGQYFVFDNTFQSNGGGSSVISSCATTHNTFWNVNNHYIDDTTAYPSSCSGMTTVSPVSMSNNTAASNGYTSSQTYGYSPTSANSPTVGAGTNETAFCNNLLNSGDALLQQAGQACKSDASYSCVYNQANHTVSCPGRVALARPASTAWDAGAYQFASSGGGGDVTAPTTPAGLSATAISSSQINLSWTASTDPDNTTSQISYKVFRNGVQVGTTAAGVTTYNDTGLSASTNYSYAVSAADPTGNASGQSVSANATTQAAADVTAPSTPTGLSATAASSNQINLSWTASTDPDNTASQISYKIYRGGVQVGTTAAGATNYSDTGLTASTNYSYTVAASDPTGNTSAQSASANATTQANAANPYPVKMSTSGRYLVDQNNNPFYLVGDTAHSLMGALNLTDAATYFANRQQNHFNSVAIYAPCASYIRNCNANGSTVDGIVPFTSGTSPSTFDLSTPNPAYFSRLDAIVNSAANYGLIVLLDPIETGDFLVTLQNNGATKAYNYGVYIGTRYKSFPNIIWQHGEDFQSWATASDSNLVAQVMAGIASVDPNHLQTAELSYNTSYSNQDTNLTPYLTYDLAYTYAETYDMVLQAWNSTPISPAFLGEANYENANNTQALPGPATPFNLREQEYWTLTAGGIGGQYYGEYTVHHFLSGWQNFLNTPGVTQLSYLENLIAPLQWWQLVPDQTHAVVTSGYGTYNGNNLNLSAANYATTAWVSDGSLSLTYTPVATTLTVNMAKMGGAVTARWFDPSAGTYQTIAGSPFANTGSHSFATPGTNNGGSPDWVLVLQASGGGGGGGGDTTAPSTPTGLSATAASSNQINLSWTASTDPDNTAAQISYKIYRGGTQVGTTAAGVNSYSDTGLTASTNYSYTVAASDPTGNTSAQSASANATTQAALPGTITFAQGKSMDGGNVTAATISYNAPTNAGDLLVVAVRVSANGRTITVTDGQGNTYQQAGTTQNDTAGDDAALFYAENTHGGSVDPTTISISGAAASVRVAVDEYSGVALANSLDQVATTVFNTATPSAGPVTTIQGNELLFGYLDNGSSPPTSFTAGTGYTKREQLVVTSLKIGTEDQTVGSVGSYSAGFTLNAADQGAVIFATFKAASSGGGGGGDTTPPTTSVTAPANNATVSGTTSVTATAADNVGVVKVEFYLDGSLQTTDTTSPYTWSWNTTTASNGSHTLSSKAYDAAANVGTSANVNVTVSNAVTPPSAPTNFAISGTSTSTATLTWTASAQGTNPISGYKIYRCTGTCSPNVQIGTSTNPGGTDTGLAPATTYTYAVAAYDTQGNTSALSATAQGTTASAADVTPPTVAISSPTTGSSVQGTVTISGTASDNVAVSSVAISIDGGAYVAAAGTTSWTFSWNTTLLANGSHTVTAKATDSSGNTKTVLNTVTVNNPDVTPPSIPTALSVSGTTTSTASLSWTASTDNIGVTGYKVYRGGVQVGTTAATSYTDAGLAQQTTYTYTVSAFDAAGNNSAQSASAQGTTKFQDTTPPTVSVTFPASNAMVSSTITLQATASDNVAVASVQFLVDGALVGSPDTTSPYTFSWNTASAANGSHSVTAKAIDTSGNQTTSGAVSFTVSNPPPADTTPPSVPTSLAIQGVTTSTISLSWTASTDNVGVTGYKVFRNGVQAGTTITNSFVDSGLAASTTYTYTASAFDAAGNNSNISTSLNGTTQGLPPAGDTTPPSIAITSPTNNQVVAGTITVMGGSSDNVLVANVQVSIDGGSYTGVTGTTSWTYSLDTTALPNGNHTITAKATDSSGNTNTTAITVNVQNSSVSGGGGGGGGGGGNGSGGGSSGGGSINVGGGFVGNGGNGGGGNPISITSTSELQALLKMLLAELQALLAQLNKQLVASFTRNLTVGSAGVDVKNLQVFLNDNGYTIAASGAGSPGQESLHFGPKTAQALAKWQKDNGLPATGFLGALTRGKMQAKY